MTVNSAMLEAMQAEGLDLAACIRVVKAGEKKVDPTNAERQQRHRIKKGRNAVTVTRYPPNDISSNPQEDIPQDANASLPQGANKRDAVAWPCPVGVEPKHWQDFLANRKRKRGAKTQTALDGQLAALAEFADEDWPPGRLVQHAAAKGWASICDPRKPMNGYGNGQQHHSNRPSQTAVAYAILNP